MKQPSKLQRIAAILTRRGPMPDSVLTGSGEAEQPTDSRVARAAATLVGGLYAEETAARRSRVARVEMILNELVSADQESVSKAPAGNE